tara:strand:+ start:438 stop:635 length:198 start_codon:yes stop_codon:yes gene_type:complete
MAAAVVVVYPEELLERVDLVVVETVEEGLVRTSQLFAELLEQLTQVVVVVVSVLLDQMENLAVQV